jgi:hypothetical protein
VLDADCIDADDAAIRAYVSDLWATDWNSPEDAVYDNVDDEDVSRLTP